MSSDECTPEDLAGLLGISERTLRDLAKRGHVLKGKRGRYQRSASVTRYCGHLRGIAAGRGGDDQVASLTAQRSRLAKEQADAAAAKNAVTRGSMVATADVEREWSDVLRTVRAAVLAVPSRVQQRLPHLCHADVAAIDREVRDALTATGNDIQ